MTLLLRATGPLAGDLRVPGDKSVSHRVTLMPLLAGGPCRATGWLDSEDTRASLAAVRALGAKAELRGDVLEVDAAGAPSADLRTPGDPIVLDCGNSGTTARLLLGLLAGWLPPDGAGVVLDGDASLRSRPMARVTEPLAAMGADIRWQGAPDRLPVLVRGAQLAGRDHVLPVASAQLKSALLLAGLRAGGRTTVRGGGGSRDHTERLLRNMGVAVPAGPGDVLAVDGGAVLAPFDLPVPGDLSTAAFLLVAAALVPGSRVTVRGVGLGPGRTGILDVLDRAGLQVDVVPAGPATDADEPMGDVTVVAGDLRPFDVGAQEVPGLVDELPALAVLATACPGTTVIGGAHELRHKESDRIALMARGLADLGADVKEEPDGWIITGGSTLRGGDEGAPTLLATGGDHRVAMALALAALVAEGHSMLDDRDCVAVSFPDFFATIAELASR